MSDYTKAMFWLFVRGSLISVAVWAVLIPALGSTVLKRASETAASLAGLGIAAFGLLVGFGIALFWLAKEWHG